MLKQNLSFKLILFDLDDTLVNSDDYSKAYRKHALQILQDKQLISSSLVKKLNAISALEQKHIIHNLAIDQHFIALVKHVGGAFPTIMQVNAVYTEILLKALDGIELEPSPQVCHKANDLLILLSKHNVPFGIVSNSPIYFIRKLLRGARLDKFNFIEIIGKAGNKTKHLEKIIKEQSLLSENVLYVGDSISDYHFSVNAGVTPINVNTGVDDWGKGELPYYQDLSYFYNQLEKQLRFLDN